MQIAPYLRLSTNVHTLIFSKIMYSDLQTISPEQYMKTITKRLTDLHAVSVSEQNNYLGFSLFCV